ncbi:MAG TPA: glycosyltransferase family 1 protein [Candidatus Acidoferrum sp.]|nr:glycosyltransferase family 1 protein [Candidatus Acidoferrum sp.]
MRIGIDAHFASYELRGMGKYVLQLVSGLAQSDESNEYVIYGDPRMFPKLRSYTNVQFRDPKDLSYPVWEQLVLPIRVRQDRLDILHCPANTAPILVPGKMKLVITVHDVMYLLPSSVLSASSVFRQRLGNFYRRVVVPRVARRAEFIIAVSEFSKREIARYLKILPDRVRVIHEGIDTQFASLADAITAPPREIGGESLDSPFILALGAGDPRKNTLAVIRVYASRWRDFPNQEKLVIVGLRDWQSSAAYQLVRELGLSKQVLFAGYVCEELLAWLYASSRCFLYPTLYEGFGFPPLEAMACGVPVITSDCSSVSEIAGDAAILVDPGSEEAIGDALVRVLREEPLRRQLTERGKERVQKFSWLETARKTLSVYEELRECAVGEAVPSKVC